MIQVVPATQERWKDVLTLFARSGEHGCWCQYWRQAASTYHNGKAGPGEANLRRQVAKDPPPGMLAYLAGEPAGWLGFWPRRLMERLVRSRTIPKIDEQDVWAIVCFMVRVGYRRQGVAAALLRGAVEFARSAGAPALEAYPVDPEGKRIDVASAYVGFVSMFEAAGFSRIVETDARSAGLTRVLMRLEFSPPQKRSLQSGIRRASR